MVEQWNNQGGTAEYLMVEQWNNDDGTVEHLMVAQWNSGTSDGATMEQWII